MTGIFKLGLPGGGFHITVINVIEGLYQINQEKQATCFLTFQVILKEEPSFDLKKITL